MHRYRINDTATGEELGVLGFDPEGGFSVENSTGSSALKALSAMADDLNALDYFHVDVQSDFTRSVSKVYSRADAALPADLPGIIMERFLMTATPLPG